MSEKIKNKRKFKGVAVSVKMDKTVVVSVDRIVVHPKYGKRYHSTKKYKVHDEKELAKVGDIVEFCEGRPVSKTKFMYLLRVVKSNSDSQ